MKKVVIKSIILFLICTVIGLYLQGIFEYKWERSEHLESRYREFETILNQNDNAIDVIFIGSSPTYAGISPNIIWNKFGITSYNFGTSQANAMLEYSMLQYLLEKETPKLVVIEFNRPCLDRDLEKDLAKNEPPFRRIVNTMPDFKIKTQLINEICSNYPSQNRLDYYFPLFRYHSRWDELRNYDFDYSLNYLKFDASNLGAYFNTNIVEVNWPDDYPVGEKKEPVPLNKEYYEKMLHLCKEKNIEVAISLVPSMELMLSDYNFAVEFSKENSINLIEFVSEEKRNLLNFDVVHDFYNTGHLNIYGQRKYSEILGKEIKELYDLKDNRKDPNYELWNRYFEDYDERYKNEKQKAIDEGLLLERQ